jgi:hypothetical protein
METALSLAVVVTHGQSHRLGFLTDQPAQRINLGHRAPTRHIELH